MHRVIKSLQIPIDLLARIDAAQEALGPRSWHATVIELIRRGLDSLGV